MAHLRSKCLLSLIPMLVKVFCAGRPHAMRTTPVLSSRFKTVRMTCAVNDSHPFLACEPALWARTVRLVFSQRTPCLAMGDKSLGKRSKRIKNKTCRYHCTQILEPWILGCLLLIACRYFSKNQVEALVGGQKMTSLKKIVKKLACQLALGTYHALVRRHDTGPTYKCTKSVIWALVKDDYRPVQGLWLWRR